MKYEKSYKELLKKEELTFGEVARLAGSQPPNVRYWTIKMGLEWHYNANGKKRIFRKDFDKWIATKPKAGRKTQHEKCTICGKPHVAKGLCMTCYEKERIKVI